MFYLPDKSGTLALTSDLLAEEDIDLTLYLSSNWSVVSGGYFKAHRTGNVVVIYGSGLKCNTTNSYMASNLPSRINIASKDRQGVAINVTDKNSDWLIYVLPNGNLAIANIGLTQWAKANCEYSFNICYAI